MEGYKKPERKKPIEKRLTFEVNGEQQRLEWIAKNKPEFLMKKYVDDWPENAPAILSALNKFGYDRKKIMEEIENHPEWEVDPGLFVQY